MCKNMFLYGFTIYFEDFRILGEKHLFSDSLEFVKDHFCCALIPNFDIFINSNFYSNVIKYPSVTVFHSLSSQPYVTDFRHGHSVLATEACKCIIHDGRTRRKDLRRKHRDGRLSRVLPNLCKCGWWNYEKYEHVKKGKPRTSLQFIRTNSIFIL